MLYLAIPVHNEEATIGVLLWRLRSVLAEFPREYQVVVYDDASTDETADVAAQYESRMPVRVLRGRQKLGYAGAVETLLRHVAQDTRYPRRDAVLLLQGDFTDPPEMVPEFARRFEGGADLVVGERSVVADAPVAVNRLFRSSRWVMRPFVRLAGFRDLTASMRLIRITALRDALRAGSSGAGGSGRWLSGDTWTANADLLLRVAPYARRAESVLIEPTYGVRMRGTRRMGFRDVLAVLSWAWHDRRRVEVGSALEAEGSHERPRRGSAERSRKNGERRTERSGDSGADRGGAGGGARKAERSAARGSGRNSERSGNQSAERSSGRSAEPSAERSAERGRGRRRERSRDTEPRVERTDSAEVGSTASVGAGGDRMRERVSSERNSERSSESGPQRKRRSRSRERSPEDASSPNGTAPKDALPDNAAPKADRPNAGDPNPAAPSAPTPTTAARGAALPAATVPPAAAPETVAPDKSSSEEAGPRPDVFDALDWDDPFAAPRPRRSSLEEALDRPLKQEPPKSLSEPVEALAEEYEDDFDRKPKERAPHRPRRNRRRRPPRRPEGS